MKKTLIVTLIGLSLALGGCNNTNNIKIEPLKINSTDSEKLKQYKKVYNMDYDLYMDECSGKFQEYVEKEAKTHPKDDMTTIFGRTMLNYVDHSSKKLWQEGRAMTQHFFDQRNSTNENFKECDKSEYENIEKLSFDDIAKLRTKRTDVSLLAWSHDDLKEFHKDFEDSRKDLSDLLKNEITGEEFIKNEPAKMYTKVKEKEKLALIKMKKKINTMK